MLDSVKITRRQSEIRQELAGIVGKETPNETETRSMETLDTEYRSNEIRFRAALVSEDQARTEARGELETRSDREWGGLVDRFEVRQVALMLDEGRILSGATAEVVSELRSKGGYRGVPIPWDALEVRAGETLAAGTPNPIRSMPIIDRLFAGSVAASMGGAMVNIDTGQQEYPVTTSNVTVGWAGSETGNVAGPAAYTTVDRPLKPDYNLGVQMRLTRKTLKQSGTGIEHAVRRDMNGAIGEAMDRAVFRGTGADGQPTGLLAGAAAWGITSTAIDATATWAVFRAAVTRFMTANAASGPDAIRLLLRPEVWNGMDGALISGTAVSEWDRLTASIKSPVMSANALAAPIGTPAASIAMLTTNAGGVPPFFVGTWGAIDLIRDPFSDAQSGALRITALATMDVTISRAVQVQILTGVR